MMRTGISAGRQYTVGGWSFVDGFVDLLDDCAVAQKAEQLWGMGGVNERRKGAFV